MQSSDLRDISDPPEQVSLYSLLPSVCDRHPMTSRIEIAIGFLVFLAGLLIYPGPIGTIYLGGVSGIVFGAIGLALHRRIGRIGLGVSILAIVLGIAAVLVAPGPHLGPMIQEPDFAMEIIGLLAIATGLVGIVTGALAKPRQVAK